ncbi:hypothetical protein [Serratia sp. DD3]|uniref:hypothetical protein n=1 Tax=Serratia sp. DD3 TaxID=1410619 RepID=UPI0003C50A81|nr:hypothetical protein [Serratia sp. DD3]KEY56625.1 putative membrane protein [Serratia sp. DD3]
MLSVLSFTWFEVFMILVLLSTLCIAAGVLLFLLVKSLRHSRSRILLLWMVLPQLLAILIIWWWLNFYNVDETFSMFIAASIAMLLGIVIGSFVFSTLKSVTYGLLFGHFFALILFIFFFGISETNLSTELQTGKDMRQLRDIDQSSKAFNRRLEDTKFRQEMLHKAASWDMPEATFRGLLARGADPFQIYAYDGTIFSIAVKRHNLNALRAFSELLDGDDEQAKNNRAFLRQENPLDQNFYFSDIPTKEEKQQYKTTAKIILDKMPELLSNEVYARILPEASVELIQFFWGYHPPEKPVYRIQAEALLGMVAVADKIAATPGILKEKPAAHHAESLLEYLIEYAPRPVIQAILERNVIQWADYKDSEGKNPVLEKAIYRARKYAGDDPQVLTIVMSDILARHAPWLPSQLVQGFYTEEEGSHVVSALHNAGITCKQLREALSNLHVEDLFTDGKQRLEEVCGVEK